MKLDLQQFEGNCGRAMKYNTCLKFLKDISLVPYPDPRVSIRKPPASAAMIEFILFANTVPIRIPIKTNSISIRLIHRINIMKE
jgi:hypothetical protein